MEKIARFPFANRAWLYVVMMKPGIIFGNAITAIGGFALASAGVIDTRLLIAMLIGLSCIVASACVFNNYIDRVADRKMTRTQQRPLARGSISSFQAIFFASTLVCCGIWLLAICTNFLTVTIALIGFVVYVCVYSFLKYHSTHATLIGSIAGAMPPVVGYCAVNECVDTGACLLFMMIALWQMPHFFAIAIYRLQEYAAASIPVLPIKKGIRVTKIHMVYYVLGFVLSSLMLTVYGYTGIFYTIVAAVVGSIWLGLSILGFKSDNVRLWARQMFICSLVVVTVLCLALLVC